MDSAIDPRHLERLPVVIWEYDLTSRCFTAIRGANLLGYPRERWLQPGFWESTLHPLDRAATAEACAQASARGEDHTLEYRMITAGGEVVWIQDHVRVDRGAGGRRAFGMMVEITEHKQATSEREALEERLRTLLDSFDGIIVALDAGGRLLDARGRILDRIPLFRRPWRGKPVEEVLGPAMGRHGGPLRRALAGETVTYTAASVLRPGSHLAVSLSPLRAGGGEVTGVLAVLTDDTQRVLAEEALRFKTSVFEALMQSAPVGILVTGPNGEVHAVNRRFEELWPSELPLEPDPAPGTTEVRCPGGRVLERHSLPALDAAGQVRGRLWFVRDLTEERRLDDRLRAADRLSSLGLMAAGVAHEVNNPLSCIGANVQFVLSQLRRAADRDLCQADVATSLAALQEAADAVERAARIAQKLKTFSAPARAEPREEVSPADVIQDALRMVRHQVAGRAQLRVHDLAAVPKVLASGPELVQVLINLLLNAAQAIPEGDAAHQEIEVGARPAGDLVELWVRDTGCGMSPEVRAHIFDPFFTTKPAGVGTGLGLSVCHGIVAAHQGRIDVESAPGAGTTFRVFLPALEHARPAPPGTGGPPGLPRSRILVVDDQPMVAEAVGRLLEPHEVAIECDARRALDRLTSGEDFDLVVCDLAMPGLDGAALYREVAKRRAEVAERMVFLTGGATTPQAAAFVGERAADVLQKPVGAQVLQAALARKLGQVSAGR